MHRTGGRLGRATTHRPFPVVSKHFRPWPDPARPRLQGRPLSRVIYAARRGRPLPRARAGCRPRAVFLQDSCFPTIALRAQDILASRIVVIALLRRI